MFGHRRCVEVRHTMSPFTKLRGSLFMSTRLIVDMYAMWNPPGVISEFPFGVAPPFVNRGRLPHLCRACCWFDLCFTSGSYLITGHACLYFASGTLQERGRTPFAISPDCMFALIRNYVCFYPPCICTGMDEIHFYARS